MWPFKKKESLADRLKRESQEAIEMIAQKWLAFQVLKFRDDVPLSEQILMFMEPAMEGVLKAKPILANCPTDMFMLLIANGITAAGTHSALEVQDALGFPRSND